MKPGQKIRVINSKDETFDERYVGMTGRVSRLIDDHACGKSPDDPLIEVEFDDGITECFWSEELVCISDN